MNKRKHSKIKIKNKSIMLTLMLTLLCCTIVLISITMRGFPALLLPEKEIEILPRQPVIAAPIDKRIVVVLDAGHGGDDGGADEYIVEKVMTEATVKALQGMLDQDENYRVVLSREYDEGASIDDRCAVANKEKAALMLSIHGNTDPTRTATGFECFPTPPGRTYHDQSLAFAQIIARKMGEAGQRTRGENGVRYKFYEELSNGKTKEIIVEQSVSEVNTAKSFGILERTQAPAVLVEQCFLTSKSDVENWASENGCNKAARIYYEAICEHFNTEPIIK